MLSVAFAHDGANAPAATSLWNAWTLDPLVLVPLFCAAWLYWKGARGMSQRSSDRRTIACWQAASFAAGFMALFLALVWPLDVLGEQLFSAHMAQHLLLMNVAAPLIVLGAPTAPMLRAMGRDARRAVGRVAQSRGWRAVWRAISGVAAATVVQQLALWIWHTPSGLAAALGSDAVHIAMHISLLTVALLFWTAVLQPRRGLWPSMLALLITLIVSGFASIVLLLHPEPLFAAYGDSAVAWGLTAAEDEHLGWGLMMLIGSVSYPLAAVALVASTLERLERGHAPRAGLR
jgi:putative membrane protein